MAIQCAHAVCTCPPAEGSDYCSEFCQNFPDHEECHCHHPGCTAPHHH